MQAREAERIVHRSLFGICLVAIDKTQRKSLLGCAVTATVRPVASPASANETSTDDVICTDIDNGKGNWYHQLGRRACSICAILSPPLQLLCMSGLVGVANRIASQLVLDGISRSAEGAGNRFSHLGAPGRCVTGHRGNGTLRALDRFRDPGLSAFHSTLLRPVY